MKVERLADLPPYGEAWVQADCGFWKTICKSRRLARHSFEDKPRVLSAKRDGPGSRLFEPYDHSPCRGLTASALAHETKRLAPANLEGHVLDGLDSAMLRGSRPDPK